MPIINGAYDAPTWNNNAPPAIDASELQDMCDTIETYGTQKADVDYVNTFVRPNLLDNAYFIGGGSQQGGGQFPINQRGSTSYSGSSGYSLDRWHRNGDGTTLTIASGKITLTGTAVSHGLRQKLDDGLIASLAGETVTFSVLAGTVSGNIYLSDGGSLADSGTHNDVRVTSNTVTKYTFTVSESASSGGYVWLWIGSVNASVEILAVKLELGDTQTLAHNEGTDLSPVWVLNEVPNFQQALARCQRYFQNLNLANDIYMSLGTSTARTTTKAEVLTVLPTPMRTKPSLVLDGTIALVNGATEYTISTLTVDRFFGASIKFACVTSGLTVGDAVELRINNAGTIKLSAEL